MKEDGSPNYVIGEVSKVGTMEDEETVLLNMS